MKRQNTFLLCFFFSFLLLPFVLGLFGTQIFYGAMWDGFSFIIVVVSAVLFFLMTFKNTKNSSQNFFIYKLMWMQEMFIITGISGTLTGFVLITAGMEAPPRPGIDPLASLIGYLAIAIITLVYGFAGAFTVYLVQKFHEMKNDKTDNFNVEKPKEGFLLSSLIYLFLIIILNCFVIYMGSQGIGGSSPMLGIESIIYIGIILIILIFFYKGNSFINLIKNIFWYIPDTKKNIEYNLKFIRNMKKIITMIIGVSILCSPIVMLVALSFPPDNNSNSLASLPFMGLKNGGLQFLWVLYIIILLTIIEGREVTKLYFETGKISAGDRFYSLKYIIAPAFLLFLTFSFGLMISFIL